MSIVHIAFYPSDWLAGTRGLSDAEAGVYINLICRMYEMAGPIERDDNRLARVCGCKSKSSFVKSLNYLIEEGKIIQSGQELFNERVQKEIKNTTEKSSKAKSAAQSRWDKKSNKNNDSANANASSEHMPDECQSEPESEPYKKNIIKKDFEEGFNQLLEAYPVSASKFNEAQEHYEQAIASGVPHEQIIFSALQVRNTHFAKSIESRKFTLSLNKWLSQRNYENDRKAWERSKQPAQERPKAFEPKPVLPANHFLNKTAGSQE